jgi:hypothetical protein
MKVHLSGLHWKHFRPLSWCILIAEPRRSSKRLDSSTLSWSTTRLSPRLLRVPVHPRMIIEAWSHLRDVTSFRTQPLLWLQTTVYSNPARFLSLESPNCTDRILVFFQEPNCTDRILALLAGLLRTHSRAIFIFYFLFLFEDNSVDTSHVYIVMIKTQWLSMTSRIPTVCTSFTIAKACKSPSAT